MQARLHAKQCLPTWRVIRLHDAYSRFRYCTVGRQTNSLLLLRSISVASDLRESWLDRIGQWEPCGLFQLPTYCNQRMEGAYG